SREEGNTWARSTARSRWSPARAAAPGGGSPSGSSKKARRSSCWRGDASDSKHSRRSSVTTLSRSSPTWATPTACVPLSPRVSTNFLGPVYTCRAAIPLLRAAGGGDIVNTSSESTLDPFPMLSMYVATKAALEMFDRILAEELRDDDIRVTTVVQGTAFGAGG